MVSVSTCHPDLRCGLAQVGVDRVALCYGVFLTFLGKLCELLSLRSGRVYVDGILCCVRTRPLRVSNSEGSPSS